MQLKAEYLYKWKLVFQMFNKHVGNISQVYFSPVLKYKCCQYVPE